MTPEQRAAAIDLARRATSGERFCIPEPDAAEWIQHMAHIIAAEHLPDDDEPPSAAELDELFRDPLFPPVARDGKRFAFVQAYVEIQTRGQLRRLVKALEGE